VTYEWTRKQLDAFDDYFKTINFDAKVLDRYDFLYVLVSGGFDSTLLYEFVKYHYPDNTIPVNCWNPYENSKTLQQITKDPKFTSVRPKKGSFKYGKTLKESFLKLPEAYVRQIDKNSPPYHKKFFPCCYHIKHKDFDRLPQFKESGSVVISGIKRGDGMQRRIWLTQMSRGTNPRNLHATKWKVKKYKRETRRIPLNGKPTFFHEQKNGIFKCYPYRDHVQRELSMEIQNILWYKYPHLDTSGCQVCPILILFNLVGEKDRFKKSANYANNLGVNRCQPILNFLKQVL
jgi:hypothetical protein